MSDDPDSRDLLADVPPDSAPEPPVRQGRRVKSENRHGDRKNPCWRHWSKYAFHHAFADPYKMVQHPDVDLVSICVRVPFHHQLGMAALNDAALGAAGGALGGALTDFGINDEFMKQLAKSIHPGDAALFVLIREMTADKVIDADQGLWRRRAEDVPR